MTKYIGRVVDLGIGKENPRGAGIAPAFWYPHISFSFDDKVIKARSEAGVGKLSDSEEALVTTKYGAGDLEGEIRDRAFGLILYSLLGSLSTSGPTETTVYTHAFSIAESAQHQSLAFVVQDPNTNEMYKLVMIDSLEITAELDQVVRFSASFLGKQAVGTSLQTVTYLAENKFTKKHLELKIAAALADLAAASTLSVKRLRLTITKNVILDDVLGTAEPEDILNRQLSVEGEIELNYEDETYKNYMKAGTNRAIQIKFNNTDALIGASTRPSLEFRMPKVDFFDWEPDYATGDIVRQRISFKASEDVSGGNAIISTASLVNTQVSY